MDKLASEDEGLGYFSIVVTLTQSQRLRGDATEDGNKQQVKKEQADCRPLFCRGDASLVHR